MHRPGQRTGRGVKFREAIEAGLREIPVGGEFTVVDLHERMVEARPKHAKSSHSLSMWMARLVAWGWVAESERQGIWIRVAEDIGGEGA